MDLTSKTTVKSLLRKYGVRASKRLGQNFLIDKSVLKKIIQAADLKPGDIVLEIGPGIGTLTQELAEKAKIVIAVEKDPKMIEILKETLNGFKNVEIIQGDILKENFPRSKASFLRGRQFSIDYKVVTLRHQPKGLDLLPHSSRSLAQPPLAAGLRMTKKYKVVANLPYYIATAVIRKFLEVKNPPTEMILMVQKEVAQRICAKPPKMNLLAVSVQFYAEPKILAFVSKGSFWPQPKVDSAIIKIVPRPAARSAAGRGNSNSLPETRSRPTPREGVSDAEGLFFKVVKAGFAHPRKQLANNLSKELKLSKEKTKSCLSKNKIQPTQRAETLTVNDWINLTKSLIL